MAVECLPQADPAYCAEMDLDEEFKRKNDKVYHWRALRLCMRNDYTAFGKASFFDIEEVVKYKYNIGCVLCAGQGAMLRCASFSRLVPAGLPERLMK